MTFVQQNPNSEDIAKVSLNLGNPHITVPFKNLQRETERKRETETERT